MATFPHSLCGIRFGDHAEQESTAYLRSEVERGIPRQRRNQADTLVSVPCTLLFNSRANADAWRAWAGAEGGAWFDFTLPRTGAVVLARIVGGNLGTLKPRSPDWEWSERSVVLEYIRPGFIQLPPGLHTVDASRILSVQRNTPATYDNAGVLQTAAANVLRYEGGQVLVEGEATNFVWPAKMADGLYNCTGVFVSGVLPDGTTGNTIFRVSPSAGANVRIGDVSSGTPDTLYSGSVYARSVDGGTYSWNVDLNDSTANTFEVGPQWVRMSASHTRLGAPYRFMDLFPMNGSTAQVEFCFPQITEGGLSSYIPTTTAPATRAADIVTVAA